MTLQTTWSSHSFRCLFQTARTLDALNRSPDEPLFVVGWYDDCDSVAFIHGSPLESESTVGRIVLEAASFHVTVERGWPSPHFR